MRHDQRVGPAQTRQSWRSKRMSCVHHPGQQPQLAELLATATPLLRPPTAIDAMGVGERNYTCVPHSKGQQPQWVGLFASDILTPSKLPTAIDAMVTGWKVPHACITRRQRQWVELFTKHCHTPQSLAAIDAMSTG